MQAIRVSAMSILLCGLLALPAAAAELGDPAPPLTIAQWVKGDAVDLQKGKGKNVYVVEFWATWCPPCRDSIPHLTKLQQKYKDKGVVFVGVSDEAEATVASFVKGLGAKMDYVVAVDKDRKTNAAYMQAYGAEGIPHAFVVDKQGNIAWEGHPMAGLDQTVQALLDGKYDIEAAKSAKKAEALVNKYFGLVTAEEKTAETADLGQEILKLSAKNADLLNQFAWVILTETRIKHRDLNLALNAAKTAYDLCEGKDASIVDTYARALFDTGKTDEAIKMQKQAIEVCKEDEMRRELQETLKQYQEKAKK